MVRRSLGLADAPLLAAAAGSALFVVESGKTRTRAAIEALNRLEVTGARILGAALTKSSDNAGGYGRGTATATAMATDPGAGSRRPRFS